MRTADVRFYFAEYVFGLMCQDIQRDLDAARTPRGGGNVFWRPWAWLHTRKRSGALASKVPSSSRRPLTPSVWRAHVNSGRS